VNAPKGAQPGTGRNAELDHPDPAARLHHSRELAHRRRAVVDVTQQVGERERVEFRVGKRKPLSLALDQTHPGGEPGIPIDPGAGSGQHRLTLVESHDLAR